MNLQIQTLKEAEKPARVALGVFIAIAVALVTWGGEELLRCQPSLRWPTVSGVILKSRYISAKANFSESGFAMVFDNHARYADLLYRYTVDGKEYVSSQISLWNSDLSGGSVPPRPFVEAHPAGSTVLVYYQPGNPQNAVLIPGADKILDHALLWGGPVVVVLGIIFYFDQVRLIRRHYKTVIANRER